MGNVPLHYFHHCSVQETNLIPKSCQIIISEDNNYNNSQLMTMSSPPIIGNNLKINDSVKKNMYINESNIQIIKRGGKIHQLNKTAQCIEIKQKHGIMS